MGRGLWSTKLQASCFSLVQGWLDIACETVAVPVPLLPLTAVPIQIPELTLSFQSALLLEHLLLHFLCSLHQHALIKHSDEPASSAATF